MSHYNLYNSLGLDPEASSEELAQKIQQRIIDGDTSNQGGAEELNLAREILGTPEKRSMYDRRLADQNGAPMNVESLRSLAARQVGAPAPGTHAPGTQAPGAQQQAPQTQPQQQWAVPSADEPNPSGSSTSATAGSATAGSGASKKWIPIAIAAVAIIGVIALAASLLTRSGGGFGSGTPAAMTDEVIELLPSQRADWAREHAAPGHESDVADSISNIMSSYDDIEYTVGETYDVKELADEAYGPESKLAQQLAQVYEASNLEQAEMVGVDFALETATESSEMKNAYLFLYGKTDGEWKLYAVTAE
ncbi:hypothetical protein A0K93_00715 [Corynebacterium sp. BCW_4722]|nr:hypothetical protein A0K93_00715 [Corynebacterium sp. BCW_4722]